MLVALLNIKYSSAQTYPPSDTAYSLVFEDNFSDSIDGTKWKQLWSWNIADSVVDSCNSTTVKRDQAYLRWYLDTTAATHYIYPHDTNNTKVSGGTLKLITKKESFPGSCWNWPKCTLPSGPNPQCNVVGSPCAVNSNPPYDTTCWNIRDKRFKYTSGMLLSKNQFKYGYFEIKFKLPGAAPTGKNWKCGPNFWLYQGNNADVPYCEIDIFEINGYDNTYTSNIHYRHAPKTSGDISQYHSPGTVSANTWHTAGLLWTSDAIKYYLDGNWIYEMTKDSVHIDSLAPMQIVVDLFSPVRNFCKYFDANSYFPYTYEVDYVKVWQLNYGCSQNNKTFCSDFAPNNYGRIYKSVTLDGGSCVDAITNKPYTDALGTNYVTLDQGFSIDNNSTMLINTEGCSKYYQPFELAPGPAQSGYISHTQHNSAE